MTAENINPFVRRAFFLTRAPHNKTVKCADCRLFYIIEGDGNVVVNGNTYTIASNSVFLWPSGTEYCFKLSKNTNCRLAIINFDYTYEFSNMTEMIPLIYNFDFKTRAALKFDEFTDIASLNSPICLNNMHLFKNDVHAIVEEFESQKIYSSVLISGMLKQLIIKIIRQISSATDTKSKIKPILEYIRLNYDKDITNRSLAEIANYHPNYVNLLMKSYTGNTLRSYIIELRLNEALKLLLNTDESIEAVALHVGFKNPTHFCNTFKKKYGTSPSNYRKSSKTV